MTDAAALELENSTILVNNTGLVKFLTCEEVVDFKETRFFAERNKERCVK